MIKTIAELIPINNINLKTFIPYSIDLKIEKIFFLEPYVNIKPNNNENTVLEEGINIFTDLLETILSEPKNSIKIKTTSLNNEKNNTVNIVNENDENLLLPIVLSLFESFLELGKIPYNKNKIFVNGKIENNIIKIDDEYIKNTLAKNFASDLNILRNEKFQSLSIDFIRTYFSIKELRFNEVWDKLIYDFKIVESKIIYKIKNIININNVKQRELDFYNINNNDYNSKIISYLYKYIIFLNKINSDIHSEITIKDILFLNKEGYNFIYINLCTKIVKNLMDKRMFEEANIFINQIGSKIDKIYYLLGKNAYYEGKYSLAINYYQNAYTNSSEDSEKMDILNSLAKNYCDIGEYKKSLNILSIVLFDRSITESLLERTLGSIGEIFFRLKEKELSLKFFEKDLTILRKENKRDYITRVSNYIGFSKLLDIKTYDDDIEKFHFKDSDIFSVAGKVIFYFKKEDFIKCNQIIKSISINSLGSDAVAGGVVKYIDAIINKKNIFEVAEYLLKEKFYYEALFIYIKHNSEKAKIDEIISNLENINLSSISLPKNNIISIDKENFDINDFFLKNSNLESKFNFITYLKDNLSSNRELVLESCKKHCYLFNLL